MGRFLTRVAVLAAMAALAWACSGSPKVGQGQYETLGGPSVSLASCPAAKCLTVEVAPWCPYCRAATPMLLKLRPYLAKQGVPMRFVVGLDKPAAVRAYAAKFGPDTALDPEGTFAANGGVPRFFVQDRTGAVIKDVPGMPQTDSVNELAGYFGLN